MTASTTLNVLEVQASARGEGSISRDLTADLIAALEARHGELNITRRDLAKGLPFIDEAWVAANFTPDEDRTSTHRQILSRSDDLVAELQAADVIVIGAPMYNFSVPAVLKAWIDMIARARLTFEYTGNGPRGLLEGKKAYVVVPSGGVPVGSPADFATPYLRHALKFVGITDVEFIGAQGADRGNDEALDSARARIAELVHLASRAA
ncbi:MAG: NAD(P)H-dependent oxidoreductase [Gammaproteobacteria bacterium]|nr:NAD(P)H-dependent oxidoreductase [Gammaproteobacteria bacterium]